MLEKSIVTNGVVTWDSVVAEAGQTAAGGERDPRIERTRTGFIVEAFPWILFPTLAFIYQALMPKAPSENPSAAAFHLIK
jgi:hypothetical protein